MSVPPFPIEAVSLFFRISATERGIKMSKQLWKYLRSKVAIITGNGESLTGLVTDFIDEMDNDEQDEITILIDNSSPNEPTEISLFESEIISIKVIS